MIFWPICIQSWGIGSYLKVVVEPTFVPDESKNGSPIAIIEPSSEILKDLPKA